MTTEFMVGDKVRLEGVVDRVDGTVFHLENGDWYRFAPFTLVSRPKPAKTVGDVVRGSEFDDLPIGAVVSDDYAGLMVRTKDGYFEPTRAQTIPLDEIWSPRTIKFLPEKS